MARKNQSKRLTEQHKESHGEIGIFGAEAKEHDSLVQRFSHRAMATIGIERKCTTLCWMWQRLLSNV